MRSLSAPGVLLRWLLWALVVLVVLSAVLTIGISQNVLVRPPQVPAATDFVERLLAFRLFDSEANSIYLANNLATAGVFAIAALLGAALRPFAVPGSARDVMTVIFTVGGTIGVVSALVNVAVNQAATFGYCDCGYRAEEVIAQDYALSVAWTVQFWLSVGAVTLVGVGAALAGALIDVSATWRRLSYLIAGVLLVAVLLQLWNQGQIASILTAVTLGILVPVWALWLARAVTRGPLVPYSDAA